MHNRQYRRKTLRHRPLLGVRRPVAALVGRRLASLSIVTKLLSPPRAKAATGRRTPRRSSFLKRKATRTFLTRLRILLATSPTSAEEHHLMNPYSRNDFPRQHQTLHGFLIVVFASIALALPASSGFAGQQPATSSGVAVAPTRKAAATLSAAERKASARIKLQTIRDVTTKLSAPEFEGRGTGQSGADKAAQYLAGRFAKLGLKPAGENGTYLQQIKFKTTQILAETSVKVGDTTLQHGTDYVILPPYSSEVVDVA